MIDPEIVSKVLRECKSSLIITERRFLMLKNIAKDQRPWNHEETVASWQVAIEQFKKLIKNG